MIRRVLIAAMLATAAPAVADDVVAYEAEGDASAAGSDARGAALDDAFAHAVQGALADLVAGDVRTAHKAELEREVIAHARLWVARFTVTKDETTDDRRQLTVSVRIDRDKLRGKLEELKIAVHETTSAGTPSRAVTILLRLASPAGVHADYGQAAEKDVPGLGALTGLLRGAGMAVRRAPASGPAAHAEGELPLEDADAEALADAAKAELVAIAGITIGPAVPVRGQAAPASLVTAHLKLLDRKDHKVVGQGTAVAAARGDDPGLVGYAIDRALLAAATDVLPPAPQKLSQAGAFKGADTPIGEPGIVLVRLPATTPFGMVLTEQRYLAGAKGVRAASLRRLSPGGWVIGVATGESLEKIAQIAKKPPATDTAAAVKIVGEVVEVSLSGAP